MTRRRAKKRRQVCAVQRSGEVVSLPQYVVKLPHQGQATTWRRVGAAKVRVAADRVERAMRLAFGEESCTGEGVDARASGAAIICNTRYSGITW